MSKKKDFHQTNDEDEQNYYDLKSDAVDRLINASEDTAPEIGADQPDPYKSGFLSHVPTWLKALFIKFWFNGAICYFILWGLSIYVSDSWAIILILGVSQGIIVDLMVNNIFRFLSSEHEYDKWMLIPQKGFWTFFVNMFYALIVAGIVVAFYEVVGILGVEPILYGLLYLAVDMVFIGIKDLVVFLVGKKRHKSTIPDIGSQNPTADGAAEEASTTETAQPVEQKIIIVNNSSKNKKRKKK